MLKEVTSPRTPMTMRRWPDGLAAAISASTASSAHAPSSSAGSARRSLPPRAPAASVILRRLRLWCGSIVGQSPRGGTATRRERGADGGLREPEDPGGGAAAPHRPDDRLPARGSGAGGSVQPGAGGRYARGRGG